MTEIHPVDSRGVLASGGFVAAAAVVWGLGGGALGCETDTRERDGQVHNGCSVDGQLHGPGPVRLPNGDVCDGTFENGCGAEPGRLPSATVRSMQALGRAIGRRDVVSSPGPTVIGTRAPTSPASPVGAAFWSPMPGPALPVSGLTTAYATRRPAWPDGRSYEGPFVDGCPHGEGCLMRGGAVFVFCFEAARPVGTARVITADVVEHAGSIVDARFVPDG